MSEDTLKQSTDSTLIATARVEGTAVFDARGEKIGVIKDVYVDKRSGQVEFVAMASGGVLGVGEKHHRLPWAALSYDNGLGGYLVALDGAAAERGCSRSSPTIPGLAATRRPGSGRSVEYYGRVRLPQPGRRRPSWTTTPCTCRMPARSSRRLGELRRPTIWPKKVEQAESSPVRPCWTKGVGSEGASRARRPGQRQADHLSMASRRRADKTTSLLGP